MRKLLERARNSSEGTKKKIVWIGTIISMIFIVILWGIFNRLTQEKNPQQASGPLIPEEITSNVKQIGGVISEFRSKTSEFFNEGTELLNAIQQVSTNTQEQNLQALQILLDSGEITQEEYDELRIIIVTGGTDASPSETSTTSSTSSEEATTEAEAPLENQQ